MTKDGKKVMKIKSSDGTYKYYMSVPMAGKVGDQKTKDGKPIYVMHETGKETTMSTDLGASWEDVLGWVEVGIEVGTEVWELLLYAGAIAA